MPWSQQKPLQYGRFFNGVYYPKRRDAGFFSLCSTSLFDLTQIDAHVHRISSRRLFREYSSHNFWSGDLWSRFFRQPINSEFELPQDRTRFSHLHHHSAYRDVNLANYGPFLKKYFTPSHQVLDRKEYFLGKYGLEENNTIAVNIRGTDKHTEVESPPISTYLALAEEAVSREPGSKILLVTDQQQYIDIFRSNFKSGLVSFDELPTTFGDVVIHKELKKNERDDFGLNFLAAVLLISKSRTVITHTGNGALWTSLFRGGTAGLTQLRGQDVFRGSP